MYYNTKQLHIEWNMYEESLNVSLSKRIKWKFQLYLCRIIRSFTKYKINYYIYIQTVLQCTS